MYYLELASSQTSCEIAIQLLSGQKWDKPSLRPLFARKWLILFWFLWISQTLTSLFPDRRSRTSLITKASSDRIVSFNCSSWITSWLSDSTVIGKRVHWSAILMPNSASRAPEHLLMKPHAAKITSPEWFLYTAPTPPLASLSWKDLSTFNFIRPCSGGLHLCTKLPWSPQGYRLFFEIAVTTCFPFTKLAWGNCLISTNEAT